MIMAGFPHCLFYAGDFVTSGRFARRWREQGVVGQYSPIRFEEVPALVRYGLLYAGWRYRDGGADRRSFDASSEPEPAVVAVTVTPDGRPFVCAGWN